MSRPQYAIFIIIISFLIVSYLVVVPSVAMLILRKHLIENTYGTNSPGTGINGPFCPSLYKDYQCCVEVNGNCIPWFEVNNGC